jgi:hypothetical protein
MNLGNKLLGIANVEKPASQHELRHHIHLSRWDKIATNSGGPPWDATRDGSEKRIRKIFHQEVDIWKLWDL